MAHIVVTGGAGFIGSHCCVELLQKGEQVTVLDNFCNSSPEALDAIEKITGVRPALAELDLCDEEKVNALAAAVVKEFGKVDYLVNGAGGNNSKATTNIPQFDPRELEENRPEDLRGLYNVDMKAFEGVIRLNTVGFAVNI